MPTILLACLLSVQALPGEGRVSEGLGVNIHFTDPKPGELELLAASGVRWVRMDFAWSGTERERGRYDFSAYERLLAALDRHRLRALFILDYGNRLYDGGRSPASPEARAAFARWAAAAVAAFRGRGVLWEFWNEPNHPQFWKPAPAVRDYAALAREAARAIREAAPGELLSGPATSTIDLPFLEECFKAGVLEDWDAVTVHPYRQSGPETAASEYAALRRLMALHAPRGRGLPVISGEWGYSAAWKKFDEAKQGRHLARQWLVNLSNGIPVSIWYDWRDDGTDPAEAEHHFGMVSHAYRAGEDPVFAPKPAYRAAQTLTRTLAEGEFRQRLRLDDPKARVLLFARQGEPRWAAWSAAGEGRRIALAAGPGRFRTVGHTGEDLGVRTAGADGLLNLVLGEAPVYLVPEEASELSRLLAAVDRVPLEVVAPAGETELSLRVRNPLKRSVKIRAGRPESEAVLEPGASAAWTWRIPVERGPEPVPLRLALAAEGLGGAEFETLVLCSNPISVTVLPASATLPLSLASAGPVPVEGTVIADGEGLDPAVSRASFTLGAGRAELLVELPLKQPLRGPFRPRIRLVDRAGALLRELGGTTFRPMDGFAPPEAGYATFLEGDAAVSGRASLTFAAPPEGPPPGGAACLRIDAEFGAGWKFLRLESRAAPPIEGVPKAFGLWIHSDGGGAVPRIRFKDASGQVFQPNGPALLWKGWRHVRFAMDGEGIPSWGGAGDGIPRAPYRWDTVFLLDGNRKGGKSSVTIAGPAFSE